MLKRDSKVKSKYFFAEGEVRLYGAEISGNLECDGGSFKNTDGIGLEGTGVKIHGSVMLRKDHTPEGKNFLAEGEVRLLRADIGGDLDCGGGKFINRTRVTLTAERAKIGGAVLLRRGFYSEGEVRVRNAQIGGVLACNGGNFQNPDRPALNAYGVKIAGTVLLGKDFDAKGEVRLKNAEIRGELLVVGARIGAKTVLNFSDTSCDVFEDSPESWPQEKGNLVLDGFVYRRIKPTSGRLNWLRLQLPRDRRERGGKFRPQPYRQLASVLRLQGHDAEAKSNLIGMANDRRRWANLGWASRAWQGVLWLTIGSGYQPLRSLYCLLGLWIIGFLTFGWGYQRQVIVPTDKVAYESLASDKTLPGQFEPFCAPVYAIDTALPIINLGQRDHWHPGTLPPKDTQPIMSRPKPTQSEIPSSLYYAICEESFTRDWGDPRSKWVEPSTLAPLLAAVRWVYIVGGWFLASMLVAGVSGLIGRE
jgi:hypothetical protein